MSGRAQLATPQNHSYLLSTLTDQFRRKFVLTPTLQKRLDRTVEHYMGEVARLQPPNAPLGHLNAEVIQAAARDFTTYLGKHGGMQNGLGGAAGASKPAQTRGAAALLPPATAPKVIQTPENAAAAQALFADTSVLYERQMKERNALFAKATPPPPSFQVAANDADEPSSVALFEKERQERQAAAAAAAQPAAPAAPEPAAPALLKNPLPLEMVFMNAPEEKEDMVELEQMSQRMSVNDIYALSQTPASYGAAFQGHQQHTLPVMPDRRALLGTQQLSRQGPSAAAAGAVAYSHLPQTAPLGFYPAPTPREMGQGNSNPTLPVSTLQLAGKTDLPQSYIIPEGKTISYREREYNLFLYSADRDWLNDTKSNRYNFSVNFDPGNRSDEYGLNPSVQQRFRDITRVEFVKAILPLESITTLIRRPDTSANNTAFQTNVLFQPYITIQCPELDQAERYTTDDTGNKAFAILQYDANWYSDPATVLSTDSRGFVVMIPKWLKCQRVFETPQTTLQKLSFRLTLPNGETVSNTMDALDISAVFPSTSAVSPNLAPSKYFTAVAPPDFFFIQTSNFFSRFQFAQGDTIQVAGFTYNAATLAANPSLAEFAAWLTRKTGHQISGIGNFSGGVYADGPNTVGYANMIIIPARYTDPTTGATTPDAFTNISALLPANQGNLQLPRRLINLSRQTQLVLRVITRALDKEATIRTDNVYGGN